MGVRSPLIPSLGAAKPEQGSWGGGGGVAAWEMFAACQSERKLHGDSGLGSLAAGYFLGRLPGWGAQGLETRLWPGSPGF